MYYPLYLNLLVMFYSTLAYSVAKTAFYSGNPQEDAVIKPLTITNTFNFSLIIYNATIPTEMSKIFSVSKQLPLNVYLLGRVSLQSHSVVTNCTVVAALC